MPVAEFFEGKFSWFWSSAFGIFGPGYWSSVSNLGFRVCGVVGFVGLNFGFKARVFGILGFLGVLGFFVVWSSNISSFKNLGFILGSLGLWLGFSEVPI